MTTEALLNPYAPQRPAFHHSPLRIADDTWLIRELQGEGRAPMAVYCNSLVILGKEPIIVDTGTPANHEQWIADVKSLVDPEAVRWIYISHDDPDHTGNLAAALEMCPNATLVSNWFQLERMTCDITLPVNRMRWVNDGQSFEAGGRTLYAIRPPLYDNPTTRGLYDPRTGLYWGSDCFAAPVLKPADNTADLDPGFWRQGFMQFHSLLSPWHGLIDPTKFGREMSRIEALSPRVIASAHTPVLTGDLIWKAFEYLRELPHADVSPMPGQEVLEGMLAGMTGEAAA